MTTAADPVAAATATITTYLQGAGLEWDLGARAGEVVASLPGERKLKTAVSLLVREVSTSVSAFVIRNPDENHLAVYRYLLRRNLKLPGLAYAIDASGDVFVRGQLPTSALDHDTLDQLLGVVLEAADTPFNELLALGFLTSMRREWDWRISRGEPTHNLEAFRHLLQGPAPTAPGAAPH